MAGRSRLVSFLGAAALCAASAGASHAATAPAAGNYATSWDEYQALKTAAHGGSRMTWDRLPDWTGVWTRANIGGFDPAQKRGAPTTAVLTPEYQARLEKRLKEVAAGTDYDPLQDCLPAGHPRFLTEPYSREFVVRPEEVWWIQEEENEVRRIYLDGRGHQPDDEAGHETEGDSIGFWSGDTLVVHTNHLKAGQYQKADPDYSDQVSTVERIRKVDATTIQNEVTVYDPPSLAKPWHVVISFKKVTDPPDFRINYWNCVENNRAVRGADGETNVRLGDAPAARH